MASVTQMPTCRSSDRQQQRTGCLEAQGAQSSLSTVKVLRGRGHRLEKAIGTQDVHSQDPEQPRRITPSDR